MFICSSLHLCLGACTSIFSVLWQVTKPILCLARSLWCCYCCCISCMCCWRCCICCCICCCCICCWSFCCCICCCACFSLCSFSCSSPCKAPFSFGVRLWPCSCIFRHPMHASITIIMHAEIIIVLKMLIIIIVKIVDRDGRAVRRSGRNPNLCQCPSRCCCCCFCSCSSCCSCTSCFCKNVHRHISSPFASIGAGRRAWSQPFLPLLLLLLLLPFLQCEWQASLLQEVVCIILAPLPPGDFVGSIPVVPLCSATLPLRLCLLLLLLKFFLPLRLNNLNNFLDRTSFKGQSLEPNQNDLEVVLIWFVFFFLCFSRC